MQQQCLFPRRSYARHIVERAMADGLGPSGPVRANGETVGFVAQPLEIEEHRTVHRQVDLTAVGKMERLTPRVAVRSF